MSATATPAITQYTVPSGPADVPQITVCRTGKLNQDVWAVRYMGRCLNRDGEWEFEPQPSSRDEQFYARCRFPLERALELAEITAVAQREMWRQRRIERGLDPEGAQP